MLYGIEGGKDTYNTQELGRRRSACNAHRHGTERMTVLGYRQVCSTMQNNIGIRQRRVRESSRERDGITYVNSFSSRRTL